MIDMLSETMLQKVYMNCPEVQKIAIANLFSLHKVYIFGWGIHLLGNFILNLETPTGSKLCIMMKTDQIDWVIPKRPQSLNMTFFNTESS